VPASNTPSICRVAFFFPTFTTVIISRAVMPPEGAGPGVPVGLGVTGGGGVMRVTNVGFSQWTFPEVRESG
jgi:hypothetical protein